MSSQIFSIAYIPALASIKLKLGIVDRKEVPEQAPIGTGSEDNWDWEWQEEGEASTSNTTSTPTDNSSKESAENQQWLLKCSVSLSPTGKVLALSYQKNIVILNAFLESGDQRDPRTEYNVVAHGNICEPGEEITCVLCVPLLSQLKSSPSGTDWTCIIVGYNSGFVRFFTEDKKLLASEQLHAEPIRHLKCQSFKKASHSALPEQPEEIYVIYHSCVAILTGFSLFQTLRGCRNQLARVQASGGGSIESPTLTYNKWGFNEQEIVNDCNVIGSNAVNTFDHLMTASICGGFDAHVKSSAPAHSLVIASGKKPYIGYHYTFEGNSQPILLGLARAMTNSIKSAPGIMAIKNIFGGSKPAPDKKPVPVIEPAEPMACRYGLCDLWRQGETLCISPNKTLCAVSDSLGRVLLLDINRGTVIRMWKGYRGAQCSWIEVKEPKTIQAATSTKTTNRPRVALFLVIYAPKKGLIEVWSMQQGPKIASFSVSKGGRLLCTNYGHVGVNNVPVRNSSRSLFPCIFIDSQGNIKDIGVPFHFALSAQNSKQARDLHLLKKLKIKLKDIQTEEGIDDITVIMKDIWSSEASLQALDILSASKNTQSVHMEAAVTTLLAKHACEDEDRIDLGTKTLIHNCENMLKLIKFYNFLKECNSKPPTYESVMAATDVNVEDLANQIHAPVSDVECLMSLIYEILSINQSVETQSRGVTFRDDPYTQFTDFISCFEFTPITANNNVKRPIYLKPLIAYEKTKKLCLFVYQGLLQPDTALTDWLKNADESAIQAQSFLNLSIYFWLNSHQSKNSSLEMLQYYTLLKGISSLADPSEIYVDCNELSKWWQESREILTVSDKPLRALTGAIICRGVSLYLEAINEKIVKEVEVEPKEEVMEIDDTESEPIIVMDWEQVSMDTMKWNELTRQLEDLALLDIILRRKIKAKQNCLSYSLKWKSSSVSLGYVLDTGKGSISELVAGWLCSTGLQPEMLIEITEEKPSTSSPPMKQMKVIEEAVEAAAVDPEAMEILDMINKLRLRFPYSLSSNPLLASIFWEYIQDRNQIMNNHDAAVSSLHILRTIPSPHLRQGMCNLLWALYLKQDFEKLTIYMNKKAKRHLDELGLIEGNLSSFIEFLVQFLEVYLQATEESEIGTAITLESEAFWPQSDLTPSLTQVALKKPNANFALLELHLQLANVLHMCAYFDVKITNILTTLFDSAGKAALFIDLCSQPRLPSHNPDQKLISSRTQFLCKVITASMQTINVIEAGELIDGEMSGPKLDASVTAEWMKSCLILANSWGVNSDVLRRHQICELFMNGHDRIAEEIISSVSDEVLLGSQLLLIAGQRLQLAVLYSKDVAEKLSTLGTAASNWLKSVEVGNQCCGSSLADILQLLTNIARLIPSDHKDNWLIQQLLDSCQHFSNVDQ